MVRLKCLSAFGFWGTGRDLSHGPTIPRGLKCLSAFGFWGTGQPSVWRASVRRSRLKCLSAFGFWGTAALEDSLEWGDFHVSNAFRLLGSGELDPGPRRDRIQSLCLKCLSAFGFWGTRQANPRGFVGLSCLKCLSAFGFWGTLQTALEDSLEWGGLKCLSAFGFWGTPSL